MARIKTSINLEERTSVSTLGKITSTFIKTARIYFLIRAVFIIMALFVSFVAGLRVNARPTEDICDYTSHRKELLSFVVDVKCEVSARLFSAADRCFPRARLQPPCPGKGYVDVVCKERF